MIFIAFVLLVLGIVDSQLTDEDKERILNWHNEVRAETAKGEVEWSDGGGRTASNMGVLVWDAGIAKVAQDWADTMASQCNMYHNSNRIYELCDYESDATMTLTNCDGNKNNYLGENVAYAGASNGAPDTLQTIKGWYEGEYQLYYWSNSVPSGTGHYTQMVWADTRYLGCGCTVNTCGRFVSKYCACNYYPGGNYGGRYMFDEGSVCSACPGDLDTSCWDNALCSGCMDPDYVSSNGASATSPSSCTNGITPTPKTTPTPTAPGDTPQPTPHPTTTTTTEKPSQSPITQDSSGGCGITVSGFEWSSYNGDYPLYTASWGKAGKPIYGPLTSGSYTWYIYYQSSFGMWIITNSENHFYDDNSYRAAYSTCKKDSSLSVTDCGNGDWSNSDNGGVSITSSSDCDGDDDDDSDEASGVVASGFNWSAMDGNYPEYQSSFGDSGFAVYGPNPNNLYMHFNSYYNAWMIGYKEKDGENCITDTSTYCGLQAYCQPGGRFTYTRCDNDWYRGGSAKVRTATAATFSIDTDDNDGAVGADTATILAAIAGSILGVILIGIAVYCCIKQRKQVTTGGPALNTGGTTQNIIATDD